MAIATGYLSDEATRRLQALEDQKDWALSEAEIRERDRLRAELLEAQRAKGGE